MRISQVHTSVAYQATERRLEHRRWASNQGAPVRREGGTLGDVVTDERRQEYTEVCNSVVVWARGRADIIGVAVVGSWARSEPRMDSDIDLVILTTDKAAFTLNEDWVSVAVSQPAELVRTQEWGPLTERRIRVASGLEIEFGFASPNWAETDPVDPGTARVVSDGCTPILDPGELLHKLIHAVN
jgi:predicted nucleotidyltransferase